MDDRAKRTEYANVLLSFIEVAVHQLLYLRGLYPRETFERAKEYGLPVHVSRHPGLNAAIHGALHAAHAGVAAGTIESVALVVLDGRGAAVEAYPFDVDVRAPDDVPATYSDLDSMLAAALTRLMMLEHTHPGGAGAGGPARVFPPAARRAGAGAGAAADERTWTLMVASHEQLAGPRAGNDASAGSGSSGGGGRAGAAAWYAPGSASATAGVLDAGSPWTRVDPGDPEAALLSPTLFAPPPPPRPSAAAAAAAAAGAAVAAGGDAGALPPRGTVLKSVRAGRMALQLRMLVPAAPAGR